MKKLESKAKSYISLLAEKQKSEEDIDIAKRNLPYFKALAEKRRKYHERKEREPNDDPLFSGSGKELP